MSDVAISVSHLVKEYEVYAKPMDLALEILTRRPRHTTFRALDGISFDVKRGEVLGIIGSNGAGKSTLLKIITGVLDASAGSVSIAGRVTAILELGLGFNPEYSGRENIYLSGLLYGMEKAEIDRKIDAIIDFSGLGDFIERPVKTYSSGMHSRLAFSIATAVDPDILIIDEALAAGDSAFVQKCLRRIRQLCSGGRTVLLVSHGTGLLAQLCQRVMWMEHGRVKMMGPAIQVVQAYDLAAHQGADSASWIETVEDDLHVAAEEPAKPEKTSAHVEASSAQPEQVASAEDARALFASGGDTGRQVFRRGPVLIDSVEMIDSRGQLTNRLTLLEPFTLRIHYRVEGDLPSATLGLALAINNKADLSPVGQFMTQNIRPFETRETYDSAPDRSPPARKGTLVVSFDYTPFRKGDYLLSLGLLPNEPATWEFYEYRHFYYAFTVDDAGMDVGAPVWLNPVLSHQVREASGEKAAKLPPPRADSVSSAPGGQPKTLREEIDAICRSKNGYPHAWPRHETCPACGQGPLVPAFEKYGFSHARCGTCGFVCVDPYPTDAVMGELYGGAFYTNTREYFERPRVARGDANPYSAPRDVLEAVVNRSTQGKAHGEWLDVGGGIGVFAQLIKTLKPRWKVWLNEANPHSVAIARELYDLDIVTDDPQAMLEAGLSFDVISSVAVLEHIPNPLEFLSAYARLLKPGGWLISVLPHFSPLNGGVSKGASPNAVPPYHVSLFNEVALRQLLARVPGLETVAIEQAGPAAFELNQHVDFGDHWDVTIPNAEMPEPKPVRLKPYDPRISDAITILSDANEKLGDFFAETDGRLYLVAYCRKPEA